MRKTKVIATAGPACQDYPTFLKMIETGVDVIRINFSHASHQQADHFIEMWQKAQKETGRHIALLADLQGPKIRVGELAQRPLTIEAGKQYTLIASTHTTQPNQISITLPEIVSQLKANSYILFDDGAIKMRILSVDKQKGTAQLEALHGGLLYPNKGINIPEAPLEIPSLTEKDLNDLDYIFTKPFHWIALSFVRTAEDIHRLRELINEAGRPAHIIAKIEKPQAIKNIDEIIDQSDAIMIARGDLGVEIPMEEIPLLQRNIVRKCLQKAKPVIVATQVFEHMVEHPYPTRAEVTDVANIILTGADAIMFSAETSLGKYPAQAIEQLVKVINRIEQEQDIYLPAIGTSPHGTYPERSSPTFLSDVICFEAARLAAEMNASAIACLTVTGYSAIRISSYRPRSPVFVFTASEYLLHALSLVWGVRTFSYTREQSTDQTIEEISTILKQRKYLTPGNILVSVVTMPAHKRGRVNTIKYSIIE